MNIGIDLDNTIINYEAAFLAASESLSLELPFTTRSKSDIRQFIRASPSGEKLWQQLQGLTYGKFLTTHAKIYPGFMRFVWRCKRLGHHVIIVSHKTENAHYDDTRKFPLREVASEFLLEQGFTTVEHPLVGGVVFHETREAKVTFIKNMAFDWFIDDLSEVLDELIDQVSLNKILFTGSHAIDFIDGRSYKGISDWQQIDSLINGAWSFFEIEQLAHRLIQVYPSRIDKITTGGNGSVYRLELTSRPPVKLKIYAVDPKRNRLLTDVIASEAIAKLGIQAGGNVIAYDLDLGVGIFDWIEGESVSDMDPKAFQDSLSFLAKLHFHRQASLFDMAKNASDACFSGKDIESQIRYRVDQFNAAKTQYPQLKKFFVDQFQPALSKVIRWSQQNWPADPPYDRPIYKTQQTLSPSDFGIHNAIRRADGSLIFTDFEYFGWDDPVKLIADVYFHPGMNFNDTQRSFWLKSALEIYGEHHTIRLRVCLPLYGLLWCLILLNDFRPDVWERRTQANSAKHSLKDLILDQQLIKANALLNEIRQNNDEIFTEEGVL
jgi:hypothetical protein